MIFTYYKLNNHTDVWIQLLFSEKNILVLRFIEKYTRGTDCCFRLLVNR